MVRLHLAMAGHGCSQGNARQRQDLSPSAERAHVASSKDKMPVRHHERIMFPLNPQARPACASFPDGHIPDPITQPHLYQNVACKSKCYEAGTEPNTICHLSQGCTL
ncbi:hypothetical protein SETIT_4G138900v2 [Setaria italica]|uniref:Uncharacterized protein n=1 Tax=Setaria italica TaxID=4555 RepID=A0A368QTY7_SETIT|nr:hypothetical protein SETIT_4G138900v2 [Setaria italica]